MHVEHITVRCTLRKPQTGEEMERDKVGGVLFKNRLLRSKIVFKTM